MIELSHPIVGEEEVAAVARVLRSGRLAAGPEVEAFEAEFARFCDTAHAVAVANGTVALQLALWGLGIGPGDEVIVPSFTFAATANAVRLAGAEPAFAEIDPKTFCVTASTVSAAVTSRTAAVIPVHLYGHPAPMDELAVLTEAKGLALVEDAAQAHGATWNGRPVGGLGTAATFSFYPTKNITTGEGGIVTTDDSDLAARLRLLRNHGMRERYRHETLGGNYRMTETAGALGRVQLTRLPGWLERRRVNARRYERGIGAAVETPFTAPGAGHAFHQYTIRTEHRRRLASALTAAGVGYGIYYPVPCHRQPPFAASAADLPETDRAAAEVLSIPIRPDLTDDEVGIVVEAVNRGAAA